MAWTQIANIKGADGTDGSDGAPGTTTWAGITDKPAVIGAGATAGDARTAIGAGTSSLALGTTNTTAKAGDYQPASTNISDATTVGKALIVATDAAAGRTAIGAGTSSLAIGTTTGTAHDGALGAAKYDKPGTGIPSTDLTTAVQTSLGKADTAYQPSGTDVAIADGGTGSSTAAAALTALKAVAGSVNGTATALTLWTGTAAQYAGVSVKDSNTCYIVTP